MTEASRGRASRASVLLTAATVLAVGLPASAQVPCVPLPVVDDRCELWVAAHDSPGGAPYGYEATNALVAGDDGVFVVATTRPSTSGPFDSQDDLLVVAYGHDGGLRWSDRYDGGSGMGDRAAGAALSHDGATLYVAGTQNEVLTGGPWLAEYALLAYDASTGDLRWTASYDGSDTPTAIGPNEGRAVTVSPDGSEVYVTGSTLGAETERDIMTIAYRAEDGAELWRARRDWAGDVDIPVRVVAGDGRVYVTAYAFTEDGSDLITIAYETDDAELLGEVVWEAVSDRGSSDVPTDATLTADGDTLLITGSSSGAAVTIAYDAATGQERWAARYDEHGSDVPSDLAVAGGRAFVSGTASKVTQLPGILTRDLDHLVLAYDVATGQLLWEDADGLPGRSEEEAGAIAVSDDGTEVYATGYSSDAYYTWIPAAATFAYDAATGEQLWQARYRSATAVLDAEDPVAAAATGDRLFVAGTWYERPDPDHLAVANTDVRTIAYDTCREVCPLSEEGTR